MAAPRHPTLHLFSPEYVICAGTVLFRFPNASMLEPEPLPQVCLIRHSKKLEYLLPKGRKDIGEEIPHTAVRETFEETGYPCALLPVPLHTRAPSSGEDVKDSLQGKLIPACTEPFAMTIRQVAERNYKLIWWFVSEVVGEKQEGTQTPSEKYFSSVWFDAEKALEKLTFDVDRDVVRQAITLVKQIRTTSN
jgi:8-oxo-dGTP pyrophosphatase MutT (NUDIX family)